MVKRILAKKLRQLAKKFPVVSLVGPRQSGKTTLAKAVFPEYAYVSLEDLDHREFASRDPRGFLATYGRGVIIDEVQRVPVLISYIQGIVDKEKRAGQFILTGSQNILLHEHVSQSLAGRVALLKLLPFSIEELKSGRYSLKSSNDCILKGFYPRIYDKKLAPGDWYPSYIQTYLERDVRMMKNISDLNTFQRFLKLCAGRIGQILNLSSLGNDCGITHNTAKAWLSILESSYIVFLLRPYYENFNKRLVKMPKLYFYDTGLACSLLGIHGVSQLETHYLRGNLFEAFALSEIYKNWINRGVEPPCYFWRDKLAREIDCIVADGADIKAIEIKAGKTIAEDFFIGLRYWEQLTTPENKSAYLIYNGEDDQKRSYAHVIGWKNISRIFRKS